MKRRFMAMLATETDTFSPIPTGPNVWREMLLVGKSDPPAEAPALLQVARTLIDKHAKERGWEICEGLFALA